MGGLTTRMFGNSGVSVFNVKDGCWIHATVCEAEEQSVRTPGLVFGIIPIQRACVTLHNELLAQRLALLAISTA